MNESGTPRIPIDAAVELRLGHLAMLQAVIARMSGYSASIKNYAVTIVAGLLAFYAQRPDDRVFVFVLLGVAALALLDMHYLRIEKTYRAEFDEVRIRPLSDPTDFKLDPNPVLAPALRRVARSWSVYGFYLPLFVGCIVLILAMKVWPG